jgi:hypothetical protein
MNYIAWAVMSFFASFTYPIRATLALRAAGQEEQRGNWIGAYAFYARAMHFVILHGLNLTASHKTLLKHNHPARRIAFIESELAKWTTRADALWAACEHCREHILQVVKTEREAA